jgi:uncharacterized membrane protein YedE/YeeE
MTSSDVSTAVFGGVLIGLAASALLALNGRVAGISGIVAGLLPPRRSDAAWRGLFIAGLVTGGFCLAALAPAPFRGLPDTPYGIALPAGFLVGLGASLGNGCTSGHGVCGVSRLARRSIVATATFMASGAVTVFVVRHLFGYAW